MNSSERILYDVGFLWKIENFSFHRQNIGEAIQSPPMSVGDPRHSVWQVKLYPRGKDEICSRTICTELVRLEGSMKGKVVCKVSLVDSDGNAFDSPASTNLFSNLWNPTNLLKVPYSNIPGANNYLPAMFLPNDTLTLKCHLTLFGDPPEPDLVAELMKLSESLGQLFESGDCSDLVLCTGGREFSVHRAILRKRAPKLFAYLGLLDNPQVERMDLTNISAPMLEMILKYLYRGVLSPSQLNEYTSEMLIDLGVMTKLANRFNLVELANDFISSPVTIFTHIKSIRRVFNLVIEPLQLVEGSRNSKFINFGPKQFLITFRVLDKHSSSNYYEGDVSIRCLTFAEEDVNISCQLSIANERGPFPTKRFRFSKDNPEQCVEKFSGRSSSATIMNINLIALDGTETHSVEELSISTQEVSSIFGINLLQLELASLFEETKTANGGDVTLILEDQTLKAHKAVLSARSPVFASMFAHNMTEKNTNRVDIPDIDGAAALRLLQYIYYGKVSKDLFVENCNLYAAADKYQVKNLFKKCSGFLASDIVMDTACEVLVMAHLHNDNELMGTVLDYFRNHRELFETSDWKFISENNRSLASRVKEEVFLQINPF